MEARAGGGWAWHTAEQLPQVLAWLDGGSDAERALAEDIYEAFQPALLELQVHWLCSTACQASFPIAWPQPE